MEDEELKAPSTHGGLHFLYTLTSITYRWGWQRAAILHGTTIPPIERLRQWLEASGITEGPLFQTMKRGDRLRGSPMHHSDVPRILKHYATLIGLDPKDIAGHSLIAGAETMALCA